jgi:uncharacterized membrane protein
VNNLKTLLFASVAINALLIGLFLGAASHYVILPWSDFGIHGHHHCEPSNPLTRLSDSKRKEYDSAIKKIWSDMSISRNQIIEGKEKALQLLKAEPFSEKAYIAQIKHLDEIYAQMKDHMAQSLVELAKSSTPEERNVLAEIMSHPVGEMMGLNQSCLPTDNKPR